MRKTVESMPRSQAQELPVRCYKLYILMELTCLLPTSEPWQLFPPLGFHRCFISWHWRWHDCFYPGLVLFRATDLQLRTHEVLENSSEADLSGRRTSCRRIGRIGASMDFTAFYDLRYQVPRHCGRKEVAWTKSNSPSRSSNQKFN